MQLAAGFKPIRSDSLSVHRWGWKTTVFRGATAVALFHALDDALLNRQHGVDIDQHALAALVAVMAGIASIAVFPRLPYAAAAGIAVVFGILAVVNGSLHIIHISVDEVSGSDVSGVFCAMAGAALLLLGVVIPFTSGSTGSSGRRRWIYRVGGTLICLVVLFVFVLPVGIAIVQTHQYREAIGDPPASSYQEVTFATSDDLRLSGWYVPSKNGAAVIVVHGGGSDRTGSLPHAELLLRHGYGVLLYDARGRGKVKEPQTPSGGTGTKMWKQPWPSFKSSLILIPIVSVVLACRRAPTFSSRSQRERGT